MDTLIIQDKFRTIGADIQFKNKSTRERYKRELRNYRLGYIKQKPTFPESVSINILKEKREEVFVVDTFDNPDLTVSVIDIRKKERHLLLMVSDSNTVSRKESGKLRITKYLCGHDERHWFVASIPEKARVKTVHEAMTALKPRPVVIAEKRTGLKTKQRHKRRNRAYVRQGEWFFIPQPGLEFGSNELILKREPLSRGNGSKPHVVEEIVRTSGIAVWVHSKYAPTGVSEERYRVIIRKIPKSKSGFRKMVWNAAVYARGWVRHPDHKTILLPSWHRVHMNTENESLAGRNVVFLD